VKLSFIWVTYLHKGKRKTKMTQTTTTIPPLCHRENRGQPTERRMTPTSLRLSAHGSRGHPPDPLDPSSSSLVPNSRKCDRAATNADQVPQQTPLSAVVSIWSSSTSAAENSDAAKEDDSLALSSTKSRTRAAKLHRASSSIPPPFVQHVLP
jgi:hypothetical protein